MEQRPADHRLMRSVRSKQAAVLRSNRRDLPAVWKDGQADLQVPPERSPRAVGGVQCLEREHRAAGGSIFRFEPWSASERPAGPDDAARAADQLLSSASQECLMCLRHTVWDETLYPHPPNQSI